MDMKKTLLILSALSCIAGCQSTQIHTISPQDVGAYSFNEIILQGEAKVELLNGYDNLQVDPTVPKPIISIDKKTLTIKVPKPKNNTPINTNALIKIYGKKLHKITATDNSSVYAKNFTAPSLVIIAKQNGLINLIGNYRIDAIYQSGKGKINIDWVNSKNLFVSSNNNGLISLGGVADKMIAKLTNDAKLDAKYLRANQAEVFATDSAAADVWSSEILNGYAIDHSNVYYYKIPKKITTVSRDHGNVLRMGWVQ